MPTVPAPGPGETSGPDVRYSSAQGRWIIAATALGSGIAFLDSTVVNVALPAIGDDLGTSISGLQWIVNAFLVTLSALLLLGGSLGDHFGRRATYLVGLVAFTVASIGCGLAPNVQALVGARAVQGVGAALLVPGSLALISASFHPDDRGRAIGAWSGLSGVSSSIGPFLGGWLIEAASWRWIFLINAPLALVAVLIVIRHIPESRAPDPGRLDLAGGALVTIALATLSYAAIESGSDLAVPVAIVGVVSLVAFIVVERTIAHPMLPLGLFRSRQFTGSNLTTLAVYASLGGAFFLVVLRLQESLGYSPLEAGVALVPFTLLMLLLSARSGALAQRIGPRIPMTIGPLVAAGGFMVFAQVGPGDHYVTDVLPAVVLFGLGMALTVAPLTTAVLASVADAFAGVASGVNNAAARLAGLIAVAVLPALTGIAGAATIAEGLDEGYAAALTICAAVAVVGAAISWMFVRSGTEIQVVLHPSTDSACHDPGVAATRTP